MPKTLGPSILLETLALVLALVPSLRSQDRSSIELRVVNQSPHVIHRIYVSPSRSPQWGDDLLKGRPLPQSGATALRLSATCGAFDLRVVAEEGIEYLDDEVELCNGDDVVTIGERSLTWSESR